MKGKSFKEVGNYDVHPGFPYVCESRSGQARGRQMEGVLATGITRRDFLRYATTAATAVGALSLAGCGSQRASEATTGSATSTSAAALFNYALNESPQALDPALVNDFGSLELCANIYEGLFRFKGETCDVEPCLAESYDVSDDGLTYTFKLREGVTFHDGTAFDASAVVTNFERQMNGNAAANMALSDGKPHWSRGEAESQLFFEDRFAMSMPLREHDLRSSESAWARGAEYSHSHFLGQW